MNHSNLEIKTSICHMFCLVKMTSGYDRPKLRQV